MAALTADRNTPNRLSDEIVLPAAAAKKFYAGALGALDAAGRATPGATATTLKGMGRVEAYVDNSAGADQIAAADIGADCYIVDDQTVAKTSGSNTRSIAGRIMDVDAQGVWVRSGY